MKSSFYRTILQILIVTLSFVLTSCDDLPVTPSEEYNVMKYEGKYIWTSAEVEKILDSQIPQGTSVSSVKDFLTKCDLGYSYDALSGSPRYISLTWKTKHHGIQIYVYVDGENGQVTKVEVHDVYLTL